MKITIPLLFTVLFTLQATAQNFTGQWKGQFTDKSTAFVGWEGSRCEYVLELECKGKNVTGYSYTYYTEGGKRYYTICKLTGTINKASKYIEVVETERTKTNVPPTIRNCFQVHRLTYFQQGDDQTLEGSWIPAPKQVGDCGFGSTILSRRILQKNPVLYSNPTVKNINPKPDNSTLNSKTKRPTETIKPSQNNSTTEVDFLSSDNRNNIKLRVEYDKNLDIKTERPEVKIPDFKFEKRSSELLKTIELDSETFTVDLYDNGDIDGDSISLFYNSKLILSNKRLTDKAIRIVLAIDKSREINELIMYAENLGSIPPNTALMVITDGEKRYEVRISSDLQKSGVIRFVTKPKKGQ